MRREIGRNTLKLKKGERCMQPVAHFSIAPSAIFNWPVDLKHYKLILV